MMNVICLMGRLVRDPELRKTPSGVSTCTVTLAVERNYGTKEERKTDFIDVVAWRQAAEIVARYCHKGDLLAVDGSLQSRQWQDKQGGKRTAWEVMADHVHLAGSKPALQTPQQWAADHPQAMEDFAPIEDDGDLPF